MGQVLFGAGVLLAALGAVWEHRRWSRVLLVIGALFILLALAPFAGEMLFS